jgi:hypothetical protein
MRDDLDHVLWMAALQDYPIDADRAEQFARELQAAREFLRDQANALTFEDEPSTFRVVQVIGAVHGD